MRFGPVFGTLSVASICFVFACAGGPGSVDEGGDNGDQYSGIVPDNGGGSAAPVAVTPQDSGAGATTSGGSSPQPDIVTSDYQRSCERDTDCSAIQEGPICTPCMGTCTNAAIASNDYYGKYLQDRSTRLVGCDPATRSGSCDCATAGQQAYCDTASKQCMYGAKPGG